MAPSQASEAILREERGQGWPLVGADTLTLLTDDGRDGADLKVGNPGHPQQEGVCFLPELIQKQTNKQANRMSPFLFERLPIKRRPLQLFFIYLFIFTHRFSFTERVRTHAKNFYFHFSLWKLPPSLWFLRALKQSWRIKFIFFASFL